LRETLLKKGCSDKIQYTHSHMVVMIIGRHILGGMR